MLLNVLVRDFPETLAVLKQHGIETTQHGAESLEEALAHRPEGADTGSPGEVESALRRALEWRVSAGP